MIEFPKDFFWGAATSSYQVEGDNTNSDWWEWERKVGLKETSGQACRHYHLYREDFDLARQLGHNAHRLSIEWSRIEPQEGKFSEKEIAHYRDVIISLRERGIEPIVTLHHFTNPLWFSRLGGWLNKKAPLYFLNYVSKITEALSDKVKYWVTINEPMVYVYESYILGVWPPQERSFWKARAVAENMIASHVRAYRAIHCLYQEKHLGGPLVSIAQNIQAFVSCRDTLKNRFALFLRDWLFNFEFLNRLARSKSLDFIGVNYYTRSLVDVENWDLGNLLSGICKKEHSQLPKNDMGWDVYPEGMYTGLLKLKRYKLPVFILENGICIGDDQLRWDFIRRHLESVHRAMQEGVKVLGYIYWSLLDNFEWDKGFSIRFGLIEVDYNTYKRTIRQSARELAEVALSAKLNT